MLFADRCNEPDDGSGGQVTGFKTEFGSTGNPPGRILEARGLTKVFGGLSAVSGVDLAIGPGEIVGLIGPNGAGKTTLFNCLTAVTRLTSGSVLFRDRNIVPPMEESAFGSVHRLGILTLILSILWVPLFAASVLPSVFFKIETALAILLLGLLRATTALRLKSGVEWARGLTVLYTMVDAISGGFWLLEGAHFSEYSFFPVGPESIQVLPLRPVLTASAVLYLGSAIVILKVLARPSVRAVFGETMRADQVHELGIARTFQNIRLFAGLTALDNVRIGLHGRVRSGFWRAALRTRHQRNEEDEISARALGWLRFVGLDHKACALASTIAYGDQRRLEIARALASKPHILLLDEPAAGMNPQETAGLVRLIDKIRTQGIGILVIEHDMKVIMRICDRIVVLDHGEKIAEGTPEEVRTNPRVIEAYLGRPAT